MEKRPLFVALAAGLAVYLIYTTVYNRLVPPPPLPEPPAPTATQPGGPPPTVATAPAGEPAEASTAPATSRTRPADSYQFTGTAEAETFTLGGAADDKLRVELTSHGAAIASIELSERRNGKYVHRLDAETDEPYLLLGPVEGPAGPVYSYMTSGIVLDEVTWPLDDLNWLVAEQSDYRAVFTTTQRAADSGAERLRITKTYELQPASALMELRLKVENLAETACKVSVEQDGPCGVSKENQQYDMRRLVIASWTGEKVDPKAWQRKDLSKEERRLGSSLDEQPFLWAALANKYFAVFTRPLAPEGAVADYVAKVAGGVAVAAPATEEPGDLLAQIITVPRDIPPGGVAEYPFEIYAGTKNADDLEEANPAYADRTKIGYVAARDADQRCCCTFPFLTSFMTGLLETIQFAVRNYGIAIIILVLIIRALLHPLTVFQQKSMYRMQEAQARLQPKINAIKEKYANDKVKQNQETMKLYSEEGVNPMASMIGMLPLLIQMPILIALWTALNTDVHLRHAGFDPWWITDLSAPDAFIEFPGNGITIPILGWLPLIGAMFTNVKALNLLPILMGVSMWLQQKYMPKPGMQAKLEAAKKEPHQKSSGMSPQDQLRQQQMIAYMMAIIFPLMFYKMPSGLNLYWMSTNVFGIVESLVIRKQLKKDKERRDREGPQLRVTKKPGLVSRFLRRMASQAEELQKKADAVSGREPKQPTRKNQSRKKR